MVYTQLSALETSELDGAGILSLVGLGASLTDAVDGSRYSVKETELLMGQDLQSKRERELLIRNNQAKAGRKCGPQRFKRNNRE